MSQLALDLGVPSTLVTEAVYARSLSAMKDALFGGPGAPRAVGGVRRVPRHVHRRSAPALYASKICSYAQGFVQMRAAAREHGWPLQFGPIAMLWRGGCIIRAVFLQRIKEAFDAVPDLENLLLAPYFSEVVNSAASGLAQRGQDGRRPGHSHARLRHRLRLL